MLGPYEVDSLLGAGGMGEVYRARDTRLDRVVAVKVLPSGLTASSDLRARFEREARAISALSNPHICAIYDVGRADESEYLVMEYLEGETLAERISRGSLPVSQVLRYGAEIAEALQHAHRAGITHRDLKPGNVMITASGVKLLDFGLAKLTSPGPLYTGEAPTIVNPITAEGAIVGTVLYMSPEQLEGKNVDHRTDIFALGCILYEMATGRRPFTGSSQVSIIAAILSADPVPIRSLQPASPPALERIILTALEKNPDERWQTAHDVARQLRWLGESSTTTLEAVPAGPPPARPARRLVIALPIAAALGALLMWAGMRSVLRPPAAPFAARLTLPLPADLEALTSPESPNFALSPDGRTLCFAGMAGGKASLYLRQFDSYDVRRIEGTQDAWGPFWSSDGEWIGFSARGKLWKIRAGSTSVAEEICDVQGSGAVASWQGDVILFSDRPPGRKEIFQVPAQGGTPVRKTTLAPGDWRHFLPHLLPDGRHFLYLLSTNTSVNRKLIWASLDSQETSVLLSNVSQTALVAKDRLAYVRDAKLLEQGFDAAKGVLVGEPSLIADDIAYFYPSGRGDFAAANGVIVYRTDTSTGRLVKSDREGKITLIDDRGPFDNLSLGISPNGKQAAVTVLNRATGLGDIWIYDIARAVRDRLTSDPGLAITPVWSPDGGSIIYSAAAAGRLPHLVRRSFSSTASEDLKVAGSFQFAGSFLGKNVVYYSRSESATGSDILKADLQTGKSEAVLATEYNEEDPQVSPDGHWLAYMSDATGANEVYLTRLGEGTRSLRLSASGGSSPRWTGNSEELFYLSARNVVMSAVARVPGEWNETRITELFPAPAGTLRYAVSPDGQSLFFVQGAHGPFDSVFHVILGQQ